MAGWMAMHIRHRLAAGSWSGRLGLRWDGNWVIERNLLARMVFQKIWLRSRSAIRV